MEITKGENANLAGMEPRCPKCGSTQVIQVWRLKDGFSVSCYGCGAIFKTPEESHHAQFFRSPAPTPPLDVEAVEPMINACSTCGTPNGNCDPEPCRDGCIFMSKADSVRLMEEHNLSRLSNEQLIASVFGPDVEYQGHYAKRHRKEFLKRMSIAAGVMSESRIQVFLDEFVASYAKLNGVSDRLANPKYDHYIEGASDFCYSLLRRHIASPAPQVRPAQPDTCKCPYAEDQSQEWHSVGSVGCKSASPAAVCAMKLCGGWESHPIHHNKAMGNYHSFLAASPAPRSCPKCGSPMCQPYKSTDDDLWTQRCNKCEWFEKWSGLASPAQPEKRDEWVSVDDEMPKKTGWYWTYPRNDDDPLAGKSLPYAIRYFMANEDGNNLTGRKSAYGFVAKGPITHWQPLPAPPQSGKEGQP